MKYGKTAQEVAPLDTTKELDEPRKKRIQKLVGSFLYHGRAVDLTILAALSAIAGQQSKLTNQTEQQVDQFPDYMATHPEAKIRCHASDMVLNVRSDALYLTAPKSRSRAGGQFFLGSIPKDEQPSRLN